ncbi:MAG: hypothetical protein KIC94_02725 [Clostridiales bacterium]|nr:hypothetical protein [Clostridiales bacterium]
MEDNFDEDFNEVKSKEKNKNRLRKLGSIIGILLLILFAGTIIYEFIWPHFVTPYALKDLNENIELPYEFGVAASEYDIKKEWIEDEDELSFYINTSTGDVCTFTRYPDYADSLKFTGYYTSNRDIALFGFKVGDSFEKVDKCLKKHGYRCYDSGSGYYEYERGRINIRLYVTSIENEMVDVENNEIKRAVEYWVDLISTDKQYKGNYK